MAKKSASRSGPSLAERIASNPALRAKYLGNPGLRSRLPAKYLTPAQRAQRQSNAFNNAPITEGSGVTNRMLSTEANNAATMQYGAERQALQADQQRAVSLGRDQGDWYAAYRAELAQHAVNAQAISAQAVQQIQGLGAGMRGLDNVQSSEQQAAMAKDAAARGATVDPSLARTASDASLVRQQAVAGFGAQQAGIGAANSHYADTLARVVAPAQQLQARAQSANQVRQAGDRLTNLSAREGAAKANYRTGRITDEQKTVLSKQALNLDVTKAQASQQQAAAQAKLGQARVAETHRATTLSHADRQASVQARQQADASKTNSHGYSNAEWSAMSTEQRRRVILADKRGAPGSSAKDAFGNTPAQRRSAQDSYDRAQILVGQLKGAKGKGVDTLTAFLVAENTNPLYARAAAEKAVTGSVSSKTAARLRRRGVKLPVAPGGSIAQLARGGPATSTVTKLPPVPLGP